MVFFKERKLTYLTAYEHCKLNKSSWKWRIEIGAGGRSSHPLNFNQFGLIGQSKMFSSQLIQNFWRDNVL